jgi:hypothetical protein
MLQIAKFLALTVSMLSLCAVLGDAFFIPGAGWGDRLVDACAMAGLAGSVCFASGLLFEIPERQFDPEPTPHLLQTLPVRLFFWAVGVMAVLFVLSWFLAVDFAPLLWRNLPG